MYCDEFNKNICRIKYKNLLVDIIDEILMVGNVKFKFINY